MIDEINKRGCPNCYCNYHAIINFNKIFEINSKRIFIDGEFKYLTDNVMSCVECGCVLFELRIEEPKDD